MQRPTLATPNPGTWEASHLEVYDHRPKGKALPINTFWPRIEARLAARTSSESNFVRAIADGTAPRRAIQRFAGDLVVVVKELPLIEGEIASKMALHGPPSVILLSYGTALAFGYCGHQPLMKLARTFAERWDVDTADLSLDNASIPTVAFLKSVRGLGLEWVEGGIAATMINTQWAGACAALRSGFRKHYDVPEESLACFDALAAYDGPRTVNRPPLLRELAGSYYHQYLIEHAVREITTVWHHMWDSWLDPETGRDR